MNQNNQTLEPASFLDLWQSKLFLGQEFLTWLWFRAEFSAAPIDIPGCGQVELWFENRLDLEANSQSYERRTVTCQTPAADWSEAYCALKAGKKLIKGRLRIRTDLFEWGLTLTADTLSPQAVKFPKTFTDKSDDETAGEFLDRVARVIELNTIIEGLFNHFLTLRLAQPVWADELNKMRRWVKAAL